ncbi:MAG: hypothetical protein B6243_03820 [Anaerolineaceae bacterium 4572_5.2]|nr:MAG: hypothetical protein B6243_03820 [Anaerolineaceae bacterium 4572_5.2]
MKPSPLSRNTALAIIIISYLVLGALYAALTPAWQIPDEPAHYNFARYTAQYFTLPELTMGCYDQDYLSQLTGQKFPAHLSIEPVCYENYQPPLYYLLAAPIFRVSNGNLLTLRLLSVAFGAISLLFIYKTIALFLPNTVFPLATTAFAAFTPMHLSMLAAVNNDALAEMLLALFVFLLLRWLLRDAEKGLPLPIIAGFALGLILLTKVTAYTALPLSAFILFLEWRANYELRTTNYELRTTYRKLTNILRLYLPALVISLPFYIRNALVYGGLDILGLRRHDEVVVGQLRTASKLAADGAPAYLSDLFRSTFHSFWGQFGWMAAPMDSRVYLALSLLTLLALVGLILWLWRGESPSRKQKQALWVMAAMLLLVSGVFAGLNFSFVQFQGRYFFSGLMPLGLFFSIGLNEAFRRRYALWMAGLMLLSMMWIAAVSFKQGGLDKWGVLLSALATGALFARSWLPGQASTWYLMSVYLLLAGLSAVSVWWFIVPNL